MAGGMGTPLWGTPQAWCVALITFAVVFALANFGKGTLKLGSVFFGMIVGMIVSAVAAVVSAWILRRQEKS